MAATWSIKLDAEKSLNGLADVCTYSHWRVEDTETVDGVIHSGTEYGQLKLGEASSSNFTEYSKITEADAIAWTKELLGSEEVTRLETSVATQITSSKKSNISGGTPWITYS